MTLDEAIFVEDAIEALQDGVSRDEYLAMHDCDGRTGAGMAFDAAQVEVWTFGTKRKALNHVRSVINSHR